MVGIVAGAVSVLQFYVPPMYQRGVDDGKNEIAKAVVQQMAAAGYVSTDAKVLLAQGSPEKAVQSALQAISLPEQDAGTEIQTGQTYFLTPFKIPVGLESVTKNEIGIRIDGKVTFVATGSPQSLPAPAGKCQILLIKTDARGDARYTNGKATILVRCPT
jgi:hypothetical protein